MTRRGIGVLTVALLAAWVMPALIGPALAGQVAEHFSWRWVFFGLLPAMAIGAWMLLPSLERLPRATSAGGSHTPPEGSSPGSIYLYLEV